MVERKRLRQSKPLKQRLMEFAEEVRNEANSLPPGVEQNQLQKKLRQADAAARIDEWANSAELQPPTDDRKVRVAGR